MLSTKVSDKEFGLLNNYISKNCGITLAEDKAYLIESRLSRLLIELGLAKFEDLYTLLSQSSDKKLQEKIIDAITTNETLWFRDKTPWEMLKEQLLPRYIEEFRAGQRQKVRIWSAAASTGQEAYSTAMLIDQYLRQHMVADVKLGDFEIVGTDISKTVLQIAKAGRYDSISIMRGLAEEYKTEYFDVQGRTWEIKESLRQAVKFIPFNLQESFMGLGKFDVIFLRYVLIYFAEDLKDDIAQKCSQVLAADGALILGNSEIFGNKSGLFRQQAFKNAVYYQVKE